MRIRVWTSFWGPLTQDRFFVSAAADGRIQAYTGVYEAGEWGFKLYGGSGLVLESRRMDAPGRRSFLEPRRYSILWQGNEIGFLNRALFRKELIVDGTSYEFPSLLRPGMEALDLTFPLKTWIYRRTVTSHCNSTDPVKSMLAMAVTIYVWFTWNALPAD